MGSLLMNPTWPRMLRSLISHVFHDFHVSEAKIQKAVRTLTITKTATSGEAHGGEQTRSDITQQWTRMSCQRQCGAIARSAALRLRRAHWPSGRANITNQMQPLQINWRPSHGRAQLQAIGLLACHCAQPFSHGRRALYLMRPAPAPSSRCGQCLG